MIAIIGAGGHAKCVYECFYLSGLNVIGFFDDIKPERRGEEIINGVQVLGSSDLITYNKEINQLFVAVGENHARLNIYRWYENCRYEFPNAIHPKAHVSSFASIGKGNFIMGGAMVNPKAVVKNYCIINTNATVGHDCVLEDGAQIGPGVNLAGGSSLGEGAFIGIGASVAPRVNIGSWTVVGAGSVVLEDLPAKTFCYGIPAKVVKVIK